MIVIETDEAGQRYTIRFRVGIPGVSEEPFAAFPCPTPLDHALVPRPTRTAPRFFRKPFLPTIDVPNVVSSNRLKPT